MAYVEIYHRGALLAKEYFLNQFIFALRSSIGDVIWETDISPKRGSGDIKIWVKYTKPDPLIAYVLEDWQLIIDGQELEQKFYDEVTDLKGKNVELAYKDYRIRFEFI